MRTLIALLAGCLALGGCGSLPDRSLIFFTHTTVGIEVAVEPNTTAPGRIVLGYKRAEGVLNPVYLPPEDTYDPTTGKWSRSTSGGKVNDYYRDQAYSVIAKFAGEGRGRAVAGTSGEATAEAYASMAQWFATGKAADTLASQPGIAGAVTGSPKIAEAAAGQKFSSVFLSQDVVVRAALLNSMVDGLRAAKADREAQRRVGELDALAAGRLAGQGAFTYYTLDPANPTHATSAVWPAPSGGVRFDDLTTRRTVLEDSLGALNVLLAGPKDIVLDGNAREIDQTLRAQLFQDYKSHEAALDAIGQIETDARVIDAARYYQQSLLAAE